MTHLDCDETRKVVFHPLISTHTHARTSGIRKTIYIYISRVKIFRHPTTLVGWPMTHFYTNRIGSASAVRVSRHPDRAYLCRVVCAHSKHISSVRGRARVWVSRAEATQQQEQSKTARGLTQVSDDTLNLKHIWPLPMSAVYILVHSARTCQ